MAKSTTVISDVPTETIPLTPEAIAERNAWEAGAYDRALQEVKELRRSAYTLEADPLNFKYQETLEAADRQAWLDKKTEIQERYPNPESVSTK